MTATESAEIQVLAVERKLAQAVLSGDRAAAEEVLDADFTAVGHAGNLVDRAVYLDIHFSPDRSFKRFATEDQQQCTVGDAVVVTGRVTMVNAKLTTNPPPARYVAIYAATDNGRWKLRYWQETPIDAEASF